VPELLGKDLSMLIAAHSTIFSCEAPIQMMVYDDKFVRMLGG
jgi:hypothetical protein